MGKCSQTTRGQFHKFIGDFMYGPSLIGFEADLTIDVQRNTAFLAVCLHFVFSIPCASAKQPPAASPRRCRPGRRQNMGPRPVSPEHLFPQNIFRIIRSYMHIPIAARARSKIRNAASARPSAAPSLLFRTPASSVLATVRVQSLVWGER